MACRISLTVVSGREFKGTTTPVSPILVKLQFGHSGEKKSTTAQKCPNPQWNYQTEMINPSSTDVVLKVTVFEADTNKCVGITKISCAPSDISRTLKEKVWYPLHERITAKDSAQVQNKKMGIKGQLCIQIDNVQCNIPGAVVAPATNGVLPVDCPPLALPSRSRELPSLSPSNATNMTTRTHAAPNGGGVSSNTFHFLQAVAILTRGTQEIIETFLYCDVVSGVFAFIASWLAVSRSSLLSYSIFGGVIFNGLKLAKVTRNATPSIHHPRWVFPQENRVLHVLSKFNCIVGDESKVNESSALFQELCWTLQNVQWARVPVYGLIVSGLLYFFAMETLAFWSVIFGFVGIPYLYYFAGGSSDVIGLLSFQPKKIQSALNSLLTLAQRRRALVVEGTNLIPRALNETPQLSPQPTPRPIESLSSLRGSNADVSNIPITPSGVSVLLDDTITPLDLLLQQNISHTEFLNTLHRGASIRDLTSTSRTALSCMFLDFRNIQEKAEVLTLLNSFCEKLNIAYQNGTIEEHMVRQMLLSDAIDFALALGKKVLRAIRYILIKSSMEGGKTQLQPTFDIQQTLNLQAMVKLADFVRRDCCSTRTHLGGAELQALEAECQQCLIMAPPLLARQQRGVENTLCVAATALQLLQSTVPVTYSTPTQTFFAVLVQVSPTGPHITDVTQWAPTWTEHTPDICPPKLQQTLRSQWEVGPDNKMTLDYFALLLHHFHQHSKTKKGRVPLTMGEGEDASPPQGADGRPPQSTHTGTPGLSRKESKSGGAFRRPRRPSHYTRDITAQRSAFPEF